MNFLSIIHNTYTGLFNKCQLIIRYFNFMIDDQYNYKIFIDIFFRKKKTLQINAH